MGREYPAFIIDRSRRSEASRFSDDFVVCPDKEVGFIARVYKLPKSRRGGRRPGAGRKPSDVETVTMSFRIPIDTRAELNAFLKERGLSMADFVKAALNTMK